MSNIKRHETNKTCRLQLMHDTFIPVHDIRTNLYQQPETEIDRTWNERKFNGLFTVPCSLIAEKSARKSGRGKADQTICQSNNHLGRFTELIRISTDRSEHFHSPQAYNWRLHVRANWTDCSSLNLVRSPFKIKLEHFLRSVSLNRIVLGHEVINNWVWRSSPLNYRHVSVFEKYALNIIDIQYQETLSKYSDSIDASWNLKLHSCYIYRDFSDVASTCLL